MALEEFDFDSVALARLDRFELSDEEPKCYISTSRYSKGKNPRRMNINVPNQTARAMQAIVGDRVVVLYDRETCAFYIRQAEDGEDAISRVFGPASKDSSKYQISVSTAFEAFTSSKGLYYRYYVEPKLYSNCVAFTLTGEKEAMVA